MYSALFSIIITLLILYLWKHINHYYKYEYLKGVFEVIGPSFLLNSWKLANPDNALIIVLDLYYLTKKSVLAVCYPSARLAVYEPELAEHILSTNLDKTVEYSFLKRWLFNGILTTSSATWREQKRLLSPAFSLDNLRKYIDVFNEQALIFCDKLQPLVDKSSFDIHEKSVLCTLDVILNTALGTNLHIQDNPASEYFSSVQKMCDVLYERTFHILLSFNIFYKYSSLRKEEEKAARILNSFTKKIIQDRRSLKNSSRIRTILDTLLETEGLSDEQICAELNTIIFAGHDTTGTTLSFALYELSRNKDIQTKVYNEIIDVVGEFNAPTYKDLESLHYTSMVLEEVSRLYPGVPLVSRKISREIIWKGEVLPKGLDCYLPIYAMHRIDKYFSKPEKFDPERFNPKVTKDIGVNAAYIPFSLAPRGCIGKKFAQLELKTILVNLLRTYEFLEDPDHQLKLIAKAVLMSKNGIKLRITKREHKRMY